MRSSSFEWLLLPQVETCDEYTNPNTMVLLDLKCIESFTLSLKGFAFYVFAIIMVYLFHMYNCKKRFFPTFELGCMGCLDVSVESTFSGGMNCSVECVSKNLVPSMSLCI